MRFSLGEVIEVTPALYENREHSSIKSIYKPSRSIYSDETSCYGSDTSSLYSSSSEEYHVNSGNTYQSYESVNNLSVDIVNDEDIYKVDGPREVLYSRPQQISFGAISKHKDYGSLDKGDAEQTYHPFKNTVLADFLADCDKLAEYDVFRRVSSEGSQGDSSDTEDKDTTFLSIRPSTERWFVLFVICVSVGIRSFVSVVFGQINDVFATYFDVGPNAVDWLTNTASLSTLFAIVLLVFCGGKHMKLRELCLFMTGTASLGTSLLTVAMTNRSHGYALAITGQIAMGLNNAVAMSISPLIAATWFPDGQVATALSASLIFVGLGEALGSYIPGVVVFSSEEFSFNQEGSGFEILDTENSIRFNLVTLFSIPAGISVCTFIIALGFLKQRPEQPPSQAQAWIRERNQRKSKEFIQTLRISRSSLEAASFANNSENMDVLRKRSFFCIAIIYGIVAAAGSTSITLLSSVIRYLDHDEDINNDAVSGRIMTVMWICFIVGPFTTGIILDKTKKYKEIAVAAIFGLTIGSIGIPISIQFSSIRGIYISHAILGFFMGASETALFEISAETTYPVPELIFASLLNISWVTFFVIFPVAGRTILNRWDNALIAAATASTAVPAVFAAFAAVLASVCIKPSYRRKAQTYENIEAVEENSPLLLDI